MTDVFARNSAGSFVYNAQSPGGLTAQAAEMVTSPPDAHARSVAMASLAAEIFETLRRLQGSDPDADELASLYRVLAEAYAHRARMAARSIVGQRR